MKNGMCIQVGVDRYKYAPFSKTKPPENLPSQKLVVFH